MSTENNSPYQAYIPTGMHNVAFFGTSIPAETDSIQIRPYELNGVVQGSIDFINRDNRIVKNYLSGIEFEECVKEAKDLFN